MKLGILITCILIFAFLWWWDSTADRPNDDD